MLETRWLHRTAYLQVKKSSNSDESSLVDLMDPIPTEVPAMNVKGDYLAVSPTVTATVLRNKAKVTNISCL